MGAGSEKQSARRDVAARAQFLTVNFHHRTKDERVESSSFLIFLCGRNYAGSLRNRANEALRDLEDDERSLVQTSSYAQDAVAALRDSAADLTQEVGKTERISNRIDGISNAVGKVVVVADNVLSQASGASGA